MRYSAVFALTILALVPAQERPAQARLDSIVDRLTAGRERGAPRPDPAALLAELRATDASGLSASSRIDKRFAESILVGRQIAAAHRDGPMGEAAYTQMLREQYMLPYDAAQLWTYAWGEFDATVKSLEAGQKQIDAVWTARMTPKK